MPKSHPQRMALNSFLFDRSGLRRHVTLLEHRPGDGVEEDEINRQNREREAQRSRVIRNRSRSPVDVIGQVEMHEQNVLHPAFVREREQAGDEIAGEQEGDRQADRQSPAAESRGHREAERHDHDERNELEQVEPDDILPIGQPGRGQSRIAQSEDQPVGQERHDERRRREEQGEQQRGQIFGQQNRRSAPGADQQKLDRAPRKLACDTVGSHHDGEYGNERVENVRLRHHDAPSGNAVSPGQIDRQGHERRKEQDKAEHDPRADSTVNFHILVQNQVDKVSQWFHFPSLRGIGLPTTSSSRGFRRR